jgi:hypothetical protein
MAGLFLGRDQERSRHKSVPSTAVVVRVGYVRVVSAITGGRLQRVRGRPNQLGRFRGSSEEGADFFVPLKRHRPGLAGGLEERDAGDVVPDVATTFP